MRQVIFFLALIFLFSCSATKKKDGYTMKYNPFCNCTVLKNYYDSGELMSQVQYKKNLLGIGSTIHGDVIHYYENGKLSVYTKFENGVPVGLEYSLAKNGDTAYTHLYKDGYKYGQWKYYDQDANLIRIEAYDLNKTKGMEMNNYSTEYFYEDEVLYLIKRFEEGKLIRDSIVNQKIANRKEEGMTGKSIFLANCGACHSIDNDIVGPKLKDIYKRRDPKWIQNFITDGHRMYLAGDTIALNLYKISQQSPHPTFENMSSSQMNKLISFLKEK